MHQSAGAVTLPITKAKDNDIIILFETQSVVFVCYGKRLQRKDATAQSLTFTRMDLKTMVFKP
jgi:hypothetical protein